MCNLVSAPVVQNLMNTPHFCMESRIEAMSLEGEILLVVGLGEELKAFD